MRAKKDDKKTGQQEGFNKTKGRSSRSRRRSAARQRKSAAKLLKDPRAAQGGAEDQDVAGAQGARITMADLRASGNELGTKSPASAHDNVAAAEVQDGEKGKANALEAPVQGDGDAPNEEVDEDIIQSVFKRAVAEVEKREGAAAALQFAVDNDPDRHRSNPARQRPDAGAEEAERFGSAQELREERRFAAQEAMIRLLQTQPRVRSQ